MQLSRLILTTLCAAVTGFQALTTTRPHTILRAAPTAPDKRTATETAPSAESARMLPRQVTLGVLRIGNYDYKTNIGDVLDPRTHDFGLISAVVDGLDFEMCKFGLGRADKLAADADGTINEKAKEKAGLLPADVKQNLKDATYALMDGGADFITGDCGFMFYYQIMIRGFVRDWAEDRAKAEPDAEAKKQFAIQAPVMMSSLNLLPNMLQTVPPGKKIVILTAEASGMEFLAKRYPEVYKKQLEEELKELGLDEADYEPIFNLTKIGTDKRIVIQGLDKLGLQEGGNKVGNDFNDALNTNSENWPDRRKLACPIGEECKKLVDDDPDICAWVIECTEAYGFAAAIQLQTGRPVFNGNTMVQSLSTGFRMQFQAMAFTLGESKAVSFESSMFTINKH